MSQQKSPDPDVSQQAEDQVEPFRRLADAIPHVFWITQLHPERVIYVSPSFEHIWGRTAQELYDDPRVWTACIHPEDRAGVEATFVEWITGQDRSCRKLEYRVVQPSGALRWITDHGVVTYDENDRAVRVSGVCTDITELKLAEREHLSHLWFLESLDRVNQAIQSTNDLEQMTSAVLDEVQRIFQCDRAWLLAPPEPGSSVWQLVLERARAGYAAGSLDDATVTAQAGEITQRIDGRNEVARFGPDSEMEVPPSLAGGLGVRSLLCVLLSSKVGAQYLLELQQCDHARSWSREEAQLFREIGRRFADAISTLWTVRQLQYARDQLAHVTRVASLGEMTASIAHEVNQPLTGIIANAHAALRWLSHEPPALAEVTDSIQRLVRDGRRAGDVVSRLKTLIRQGDQSEKSSVDVNLVVRETLPLVRSEIQQNRVAIELDLASELPHVGGDRVQIQQVLLNLISNALEAMVSVEERPCRLRIQTSVSGGETVSVSVHDTGVGLEPGAANRIFDAFFTTKPQGMGMGLAISRSIVEDHGGRLSVTSRPGEGSTFQFTLVKAPKAP